MTVENDNRSELDLLGRRTNALHLSFARRLIRFRLLILVPLVLFLAWEVVTRSLAAYFADVQPETAIGLRSSEPEALSNLAEAKLRSLITSFSHSGSGLTSNLSDQHNAQDLELDSKSDAAPAPRGGQLASPDLQVSAEIRAWGERALRNDPLNARAFRILGELSQADSNDKQAQALMRASLRRSLHEGAVVYWLMQKSYQEQDYLAAIGYADTLLRTRSDVAKYVMPMLGHIAETEGASNDLKRLLASNPPWRHEFFDRLPSSVSDARTPLDILLSLSHTPTPPTADDLRSYLTLLIDHRLYDLAYYTWLQFLPPDQLRRVGRLFNGDFEVPPSGSPFDWIFTQGSGVTIKVAVRPDKAADHALFMSFGGQRLDTLGVKQLILLTPGSYRFQGSQKSEIVSQRNLRWHITCINQAATEIAESPIVNSSGPAWSDFAFSFSVPETDCPAQYLWLDFDARWASEKFISGSIWFDDLKIERESALNP